MNGPLAIKRYEIAIEMHKNVPIKCMHNAHAHQKGNIKKYKKKLEKQLDTNIHVTIFKFTVVFFLYLAKIRTYGKMRPLKLKKQFHDLNGTKNAAKYS